jgi:hypothetical protein
MRLTPSEIDSLREHARRMDDEIRAMRARRKVGAAVVPAASTSNDHRDGDGGDR